MIAQGAAASATGYVTECLEIDPEQPVPDAQHQALILTLSLVQVLLEVNLKGMIRNPAARDQVRSTIEELSRQIFEKAGLDRDEPRVYTGPV